MKLAKFEIFVGKNDLWYWRLVSINGQIVAQSEGYSTEYNARRGIRACRRAALFARVVSDE